MKWHSHYANLSLLSSYLEELFLQVPSGSEQESLPQDLADEIGATAGEIMVELTNQRGERPTGKAIKDARLLRDIVRTVYPEAAQVSSAGHTLIEDLAAILREK